MAILIVFSLYRVRLLIQENTKPMQVVFCNGYDKIKGLYTKADESYTRIYHPNMWFNVSIISGSIFSGWILQALIFPKRTLSKHPFCSNSDCLVYI